MWANLGYQGRPTYQEARIGLCLAEPWVGIPCGVMRTSCQGPARVLGMSRNDVVKRLWVRGWREVTDPGDKRTACFLYPT